MENSTEQPNIMPKVGFFGFFTQLFSNKSTENGGWTTVFKLVLAIFIFIIPTLLAWGVWQTNETFANKENRIRVERIETYIEEINKKLDTLPPQDWRDRIISLEKFTTTFSMPDIYNRLTVLEAEQKLIRAQILSLETRNSEDHQRILVLLEAIKTKLNVQ